MLFTNGASGGFRRGIKQRHDAGKLTALTPTCFIPTSEWEQAQPSDRFLKKAVAVGTFHKSAVLTGRGAAALYGMPITDYSPNFQLLRKNPSNSPLTGVKIKRAPAVAIDDSRTIRYRTVQRTTEITVTDIPTTIAYLAIYDSLEAAVVAADYCLQKRRTTKDELAAKFSELANRTNRTLLKNVLRCVSIFSESPRETQVRLAMLRFGLTGFSTQPTIILKETGRRIRPDFVFLKWMVIVEYDGADKYKNGDAPYLRSEIDRQHEISNAGFTIVRIRNKHFKDGTWLTMIKSALRHQFSPLPDTFWVEDPGETFE